MTTERQYVHPPIARPSTEEISKNTRRISILAPKSGSKEIAANQPRLGLELERDVGGVGMAY